MVESLTRGRIAEADGAHLDPDLRRDATRRTRGWRPIFGQAGAAQSHLARHRVGPGDLFLFFGSFRRSENRGGELRFVPSEPKLHVIFGWLQVAEVRRVTDALSKELQWAEKHPHLSEPARYKSNTLYLASRRLSSLDVDSPGGGVFERLRPELILTETNPYSGCATWILPRWIHPRARTPLSYHSRQNRWTNCEGSVRLRSAYPGQEFVLDLDEYPEAYDWLREIFSKSKPAS